MNGLVCGPGDLEKFFETVKKVSGTTLVPFTPPSLIEVLQKFGVEYQFEPVMFIKDEPVTITTTRELTAEEKAIVETSVAWHSGPRGIRYAVTPRLKLIREGTSCYRIGLTNDFVLKNGRHWRIARRVQQGDSHTWIYASELFDQKTQARYAYQVRGVRP